MSTLEPCLMRPMTDDVAEYKKSVAGGFVVRRGTVAVITLSSSAPTLALFARQ